ncbi:MAG: PAS domain-containing sensor histidine kinase [Alphaproteobacteria bacterium]
MWLTSGIAQSIVVINGAIITITAFFVFNYMIGSMSVEEYKRTSQGAGSALVEGISNLENSMRLVTSIILLSESQNKDALSAQIRRNVPNLNHFDQVVWVYEESPGNWQYKIISETQHQLIPRAHYKMVPDKDLITHLVMEGFFANESLRIISEFPGMDYVEETPDPQTMVRSFAFVKTVKAQNSNLGIVIGVTRASLLFDQGFMAKNDSVSRFTIREVQDGRRIYHMDDTGEDDSVSQRDRSLKQDYGFFIGDSEWQVVLEFSKNRDAYLLEMVPFIVLFFGGVLTTVGTLFIRSNNKQSKKLANVNAVLELKNRELEAEITERERLNSALVTAEKDNRAIIDSVSDIIFEADVNGQVLFLSAAWQKVTGFEIERSKGSDLFSMLYPEDQERQREEFQQLIKGQKQAYRSFTRIRISDGTFRAIELAFSMIRQDENKKLRAVGTITDVEERRRAERALAEAEKKYRTIVENAAGGLYQLTPEGIYLSANPAMARILGYQNPEEMLRMIKNAKGTVYADSPDRGQFVEALISQGQIFGYETEASKKDKTKIWVRENIRVVKDEQNNVLYFEGSMEDITQRKEADIALMEAKIQSDMANRAKTEFIGNMSHELRTPLNAIIGFSDIMKNEVMGPLGQDMYKEYVEDIHDSGVGLLKIINEILDISKIEAGNRELTESEFSAQDVLAGCMDLYASRVQEKGISITDEVRDMPVLRGEELSIKQVLGNVYTNAIQYTPSGGRITMFTNYDMDGSFRLSISDTGIGMSAKEIDKALSPFGQVDNALDRAGAGVGLGLPLAQAMMKAHGGRVEILSEKGIGTTLTLVFPSDRVLRTNTQDGTAEPKQDA